MEESRGAAEFSHVPRLDRWGASRARASLRSIFQPDSGVGPMSRFSSRKVLMKWRGVVSLLQVSMAQSLFGVLLGSSREGREGREGAGT